MRELSLHILDIIQNSLAAGADQIDLRISEDLQKDCLIIVIKDNGLGMEPEMVERITDPFTTSRKTREVGLGIPLLKAAAERCGGCLQIDSTPGEGTVVKALFKHSHIDRAPVGDMPETIVSLLAVNPDLNINYKHQIDEKSFFFRVEEVREELDGLAINKPVVLNWIKEYLKENVKELHGGEE